MADIDNTLTDSEIFAIATQADTAPITPFQLEGSVKVGVISDQILRFARAVLNAQNEKNNQG